MTKSSWIPLGNGPGHCPVSGRLPLDPSQVSSGLLGSSNWQPSTWLGPSAPGTHSSQEVPPPSPWGRRVTSFRQMSPAQGRSLTPHTQISHWGWGGRGQEDKNQTKVTEPLNSRPGQLKFVAERPFLVTVFRHNGIWILPPPPHGICSLFSAPGRKRKRESNAGEICVQGPPTPGHGMALAPSSPLPPFLWPQALAHPQGSCWLIGGITHGFSEGREREQEAYFWWGCVIWIYNDFFVWFIPPSHAGKAKMNETAVHRGLSTRTLIAKEWSRRMASSLFS